MLFQGTTECSVSVSVTCPRIREMIETGADAELRINDRIEAGVQSYLQTPPGYKLSAG